MGDTFYKNICASALDKSGGSGIIEAGSEKMLKVSTGGHRNEAPLNSEQINNCIDYARMLGFKSDIAYSDYSYTAFVGSVEGEKYCRMVIGTDVFPCNTPTSPNEKLSYKAAIAHEVIGHYEAWKGGFEQSVPALDEAQASIRAARFAEGLTKTERTELLKDAVLRLRNADIPLKEARKHIKISER